MSLNRAEDLDALEGMDTLDLLVLFGFWRNELLVEFRSLDSGFRKVVNISLLESVRYDDFEREFDLFLCNT